MESAAGVALLVVPVALHPDAAAVSFDHALGESFYNDRLAGVVKKLQERGIIRESEGALVNYATPEAAALALASLWEAGKKKTDL